MTLPNQTSHQGGSASLCQETDLPLLNRKASHAWTHRAMRAVSRAHRDVALCLDRLSQDAIARGEGGIHLPLTELAKLANVGYATVKRAMEQFRAEGWILESPGQGMLFASIHGTRNPLDPQPPEAQGEPAEPPPMAQNEPAQYKEEKHVLRRNELKACMHSVREDEAQAEPEPTKAPEAAGEQPLSPDRKAMLDAAVGMLIKAGADRPGAVAAARTALAEHRLSLEFVQKVIQTVRVVAPDLNNPGGLMCKALVDQKLWGSIGYQAIYRSPRTPLPNDQHEVFASAPLQADPSSPVEPLPTLANETRRAPRPQDTPLVCESVEILIRAGADRGGALAAARKAQEENRLSLKRVTGIVETTLSLGDKIKNPGGMMCCALKDPRQEKSLRREFEAKRKKGTLKPVHLESMEPTIHLTPEEQAEQEKAIKQIETARPNLLKFNDFFFFMACEGITSSQIKEYLKRNPTDFQLEAWAERFGKMSKSDR